jgi:hypothetical protein
LNPPLVSRTGPPTHLSLFMFLLELRRSSMHRRLLKRKEMRKECVNRDAKTGCCLAPELLCMKCKNRRSRCCAEMEGCLTEVSSCNPHREKRKGFFRITGFQNRVKICLCQRCVVELIVSYPCERLLSGCLPLPWA